MKAKSILAYPGVLMSEDGVWGNRYIGTADALLAAGLVELNQLPGQPTSGKTMTSFCPDGSKVRQGTNGPSKLPGYKQVKKVGKKFEALIQQGLDEQKKRDVLRAAERDLWIAGQRMVPRYCPTFTPPARPARGHLRLVWSAPI